MPLSNPRHRRNLLVALAAGLVAVVGTLANAHSGGGRGQMMGRGSEDPLEHMQQMLTSIGASDAQKAPIKGILTPAFEEMKAAHDAHSAALAEQMRKHHGG